MMAALAVCFSITSCGDDDSIDRGTHATLPETVIAGTYTGTYSAYNNDSLNAGVTTPESTAPATITIKADTAKYTIRLISTCADFDKANGEEQNALNCSWANDEIKFWGVSTAGTAAGYLNSASLNGSYESDSLKVRFMKSWKVGRKTYTYFYQFNGKKN